MNRRAFIVALLATDGRGQKEDPKRAAEAPPRYVDAALKGSKSGELPVERNGGRAAE